MLAAASDMLRQSELNTTSVHGAKVPEVSPKLADLSLIMRTAAPSKLLLHLAHFPSGFLGKLISCLGRMGGIALRRKVRTDAVKCLTALECYLIAHRAGAGAHAGDSRRARRRGRLPLRGERRVPREQHVHAAGRTEYVVTLKTLSIAGESLLQLEEGLRARRTALELVTRMMKHIHHQAHDRAPSTPGRRARAAARARARRPAPPRRRGAHTRGARRRVL